MHKNAQITLCKKTIRAEASSRNYQQALKDKKNAAEAEQQVKQQLEAAQAQVKRERTRSQKMCEGQEMYMRVHCWTQVRERVSWTWQPFLEFLPRNWVKW